MKRVIEHNVVANDNGEKFPAVVINGDQWGDDFENLCEMTPEVPKTFHYTDGVCPKTGRAVTYHQTFILSDKTDEELIAMLEGAK
jgi:hypothetical protein